MNTCKLIRDQLGHDAESCLSPIETELGYKVNTLVTYRGFTIHMKYLEEHDGLRLFFDPKKDEHAYMLYKGRKVVWNGDCPPNEYNITRECSRSRVLIVHSAFCFMMRARRAAAAWATDDARAATWSALDALDATWVATWVAFDDARDTLDDVRDTLDAARDTLDAARVALDALNTLDPLDAARVALDDARDTLDPLDHARAVGTARAHVRKAFRAMIRWRKTQ